MVQGKMTALKNKILAITRNEKDAVEFSKLVGAKGGRAIALPTIEIVPAGPQAAQEFLDKLQSKKHDYCAFMSSQAVNVLFELAGEKAIQALNSTKVIAVGPKTKQSLKEHGVQVTLVPEKFSSAGLVELLSKLKPKGKKIIIPRSGAANEFASQALADLGMVVDEVLLYTVQTCTPAPVWSEFSSLLQKKRIDAVIFTSTSNVSSFFEIMGDMQLDSLTKVISIGPFTSKELKKRKIKYVEAEEHTVMGALELARQVV
jgi:uroporphyrinogen-III synthase